MIDRGRLNVIGIKVDAVDFDAAVARIIAAAKAGQTYRVTALASHGVMTGFDDPPHAHRLNELDLVVPDGQPVRWALNWLHGANLSDTVAGPELTLRTIAAAAREGLPIYLYGTVDATLEKLSANLKASYPGLVIAGMEQSKFRTVSAEEQAVINERIKASGAKLVFVGLGCPRQEVWVYENAPALSMPALAVGAAFDFHAGNIHRPPMWINRIGLEWFVRLLQEPKRLWRRYLILGSRYLWAVAKQKLGIARYPDTGHPAPAQRIGYG